MTEKVFTIREDKTAFVANEIMQWGHFRHVPVVDHHDRLVGIISHRDLLKASMKALETAGAERRRPTQASVTQIMHSPVHTIPPTATVQEAASMMRRLKVSCLPVTEYERLVGIVTAYDIIRVMEHLPSTAFGAAAAAIGR